jgi:hypothetical protein
MALTVALTVALGTLTVALGTLTMGLASATRHHGREHTRLIHWFYIGRLFFYG